MITLSIRYTLDAGKLADFAAYAKDLQPAIERCGGTLQGYYLPTKFAGATNIGLALIDFPSLAVYEEYRRRLLTDAGGSACLRRAEQAGCILVEDRSFLQRVTPE